MKNNLILVTGGAGYIGCRLIPELLKNGYRVRVFDKLIFGDEGLSLIKDKIELVQGDICSFDPKVLHGVSSVVHLAGLSNDPTAEYNPRANKIINTDATIQIAEACLSKNVSRFVFASSCSIYYSLKPYTNELTETSEISPTAPYSLSKKEAELGLLELSKKYPSFYPSFLRQGTIFGWSPRMRYDLVVNVFARNAWSNGELTVFNGGEIWRPLLYVGDAANAYITLLQSSPDKIKGEAFNLLHKNYRILELAHWCKHILSTEKKVDVSVRYKKEALPRSYNVSASKWIETFGYCPPTGITIPLKEIWDCFKQGISTDFDNPIYYNLKWLELLVQMENRLKTISPIFP